MHPHQPQRLGYEAARCCSFTTSSISYSLCRAFKASLPSLESLGIWGTQKRKCPISLKPLWLSRWFFLVQEQFLHNSLLFCSISLFGAPLFIAHDDLPLLSSAALFPSDGGWAIVSSALGEAWGLALAIKSKFDIRRKKINLTGFWIGFK